MITINKDTHIYKKNSIFLIPPYTPHAIAAEKYYTLLSLCIDKTALAKWNMKQIKYNIQNLLNSAFGENLLNQTQIFQLIRSLNKLNNLLIPNFKMPYIDFLKTQLELFPEMKFSIEEMAGAVHISKYYLIRSFRQEVGLTPHQFQIQNRVRKAQHMLKHSDTITEIALTAGFCDHSHFIKQFEKYVGLTPTIYKISCRTLSLIDIIS